MAGTEGRDRVQVQNHSINSTSPISDAIQQRQTSSPLFNFLKKSTARVEDEGDQARSCDQALLCEMALERERYINRKSMQTAPDQHWAHQSSPVAAERQDT